MLSRGPCLHGPQYWDVLVLSVRAQYLHTAIPRTRNVLCGGDRVLRSRRTGDCDGMLPAQSDMLSGGSVRSIHRSGRRSGDSVAPRREPMAAAPGSRDPLLTWALPGAIRAAPERPLLSWPTPPIHTF